jgi:hypothetical protein
MKAKYLDFPISYNGDYTDGLVYRYMSRREVA